MKGAKDKVAIIGITYRCNQNCVFCLDRERRRGGDMPFDEVRKLFEDLRESGVRRAIFMTGETGLRADFFDVLDLAADMDLSLALTTNGMVFEDADFLAETVAHGLTDFNVSIHGTEPEVVESICGVRGGWDRQRRALANMNDYSKRVSPLEVYTKTVVCRSNVERLVTIADDLASLLPDARLTLGFKQAVPLDAKAAETVAPYRDARSGLASLVTHVQEHGLTTLFDGFPLCCLAGGEHHSRELADLVAHREYRLAMPAKDEAWIPLGAEYRKTPGCESCPLTSLCLGGLASVLDLSGEDLEASQGDPVDVASAVLNARPEQLGAVSPQELLETIAGVVRAVEAAPRRRVERGGEGPSTIAKEQEPVTPDAQSPVDAPPVALSPRLATLSGRLRRASSSLTPPAPWRVSSAGVAEGSVYLVFVDGERRVRFMLREHRSGEACLARVGPFDLLWAKESGHKGEVERHEIHTLARSFSTALGRGPSSQPPSEPGSS
jgi:pyruvate-formate lyase-activating enzyme